MTIAEAIERYVAVLRPSLAEGVRTTLLRFFDAVLLENVAILTAAQVKELRACLVRRGGLREPLTDRARDHHWRTGRRFLTWCVEQRLLSADPLAPRKPEHIGELVRRLREESGIFRRDLANQAGLPIATLRSFETGRLHLSREQLLHLLKHPAMASLPEKVKEAGLDLGLGNNGVGKA